MVICFKASEKYYKITGFTINTICHKPNQKEKHVEKLLSKLRKIAMFEPKTVIIKATMTDIADI